MNRFTTTIIKFIMDNNFGKIPCDLSQFNEFFRRDEYCVSQMCLNRDDNCDHNVLVCFTITNYGTIYISEKLHGIVYREGIIMKRVCITREQCLKCYGMRCTDWRQNVCELLKIDNKKGFIVLLITIRGETKLSHVTIGKIKELQKFMRTMCINRIGGYFDTINMIPKFLIEIFFEYNTIVNEKESHDTPNMVTIREINEKDKQIESMEDTIQNLSDENKQLNEKILNERNETTHKNSEKEKMIQLLEDTIQNLSDENKQLKDTILANKETQDALNMTMIFEISEKDKQIQLLENKI